MVDIVRYKIKRRCQNVKFQNILNLSLLLFLRLLIPLFSLKTDKASSLFYQAN